MTYPPPEPPQQYPGPPQQYPGPPSSGQPWSGPPYGTPPPPYGTPPPAYGDQPQYHPVPPYGTPPPATGSKAWIWVVSAVAAALLLCVGGVVAVVVAAGNFAQEVQREAASPLVEPAPFDPSAGPSFEPRPDETEPEPELLKLGETLVITTDKGDAYEVTVKNKRLRKKGCDPYALKPDNGGYLVADVTVKVVKGTADISPYDFSLVVADGSTMGNTAGVASGCGDDLDSVHGLKAGARRSGQLVFDVGAAKGDITYKVDGTIAGSWKVG